jgi:hypothetical protein
MTEKLIMTDQYGRKLEVTEEQFFASIDLFHTETLRTVKNKPYWLERYLQNLTLAETSLTANR